VNRKTLIKDKFVIRQITGKLRFKYLSDYGDIVSAKFVNNLRGALVFYCIEEAEISLYALKDFYSGLEIIRMR
jgi:hypothetical protein